MNHRLTLSVFGLLLIVVTLLSSVYGAWREIALQQPQFDIVVEVDAPKRLGCFEAYLNANYESPIRACLTRDGPSTLVLANVPSRISVIRFDTGDEPDIEFTLRSVKFVTATSYGPAPGRILREFQASDIAAWAPADLTIDGKTGRIRTASRDPQFHARLDLDLAAILGAIPEGMAILKRVSKSLLAMLALELVAAILLGLIVWKAYRRAASREQNNAWIIVLCFFGFLLTVISAYPGHTTYDETYSLTEHWTGKLSDLHPPLHTIVWSALMDVGRLLGLDPLQQAALLLVVQSALFWSAAGMLAAGFFQSKWLARGFLFVLAFSPVSLVYLGSIAKDNQLAVSLFVAVVWIALAVRRRSLALLMLATLPLFYAVAIRSNGPAAVLPLCFFWVAAVYQIRGISLNSTRKNLLVVGLSVVFFVTLLGANRGLTRLVVKNPCCYGQQAFMTLIYDLMGVSVRVDRNLVPRVFHQDPAYNLETIKQRFDQYTLNFDGINHITPDLFMPSITAWLQALQDHPNEVVRHRLMVLGNFFGMYTGRAPAPYMNRFYVGARTIQLPDRARAIMTTYENMGRPFLDVRNFFEAYAGLSRGWPAYRLWIYIVVVAALFAVPAPRPPAIADPAVWLTVSAVCYLLPYLVLANSAHFRYVWWSAFAMFTASVLRIDAILQYLRTKRMADGSTSQGICRST